MSSALFELESHVGEVAKAWVDQTRWRGSSHMALKARDVKLVGTEDLEIIGNLRPSVTKD